MCHQVCGWFQGPDSKSNLFAPLSNLNLFHMSNGTNCKLFVTFVKFNWDTKAGCVWDLALTGNIKLSFLLKGLCVFKWIRPQTSPWKLGLLFLCEGVFAELDVPPVSPCSFCYIGCVMYFFMSTSGCCSLRGLLYEYLFVLNRRDLATLLKRLVKEYGMKAAKLGSFPAGYHIDI